MKTAIGFIGLVVVAMLGGCAPPAYYGYGEQYPIVSAPPVQYAPQQVAPVYIPVYRPQYYMAPMYGGYYGAPMYYYGGEPLFRFNFNFGKSGRHHGSGRHHRR